MVIVTVVVIIFEWQQSSEVKSQLSELLCGWSSHCSVSGEGGGGRGREGGGMVFSSTYHYYTPAIYTGMNITSPNADPPNSFLQNPKNKDVNIVAIGMEGPQCGFHCFIEALYMPNGRDSLFSMTT